MPLQLTNQVLFLLPLLPLHPPDTMAPASQSYPQWLFPTARPLPARLLPLLLPHQQALAQGPAPASRRPAEQRAAGRDSCSCTPRLHSRLHPRLAAAAPKTGCSCTQARPRPPPADVRQPEYGRGRPQRRSQSSPRTYHGWRLALGAGRRRRPALHGSGLRGVRPEQAQATQWKTWRPCPKK